ncbi:hypothetical protein [Nocardia sp. NPDC004711]
MVFALCALAVIEPPGVDLTGSTVHDLLADILARYGSIDVFIARLHALLEAP